MHMHETEFIAHIDDDIFFVLLKGKQASPMFAEAVFARLNATVPHANKRRRPRQIGSLQVQSYWFGPSMNVLPQVSNKMISPNAILYNIIYILYI